MNPQVNRASYGSGVAHTGTVMDEVFDEVTDNGVEHRHHHEGAHQQVHGVLGQVDGVPGRGDVGLKVQRPVVLPVVDVHNVCSVCGLHGCDRAVGGNASVQR